MKACLYRTRSNGENIYKIRAKNVICDADGFVCSLKKQDDNWIAWSATSGYHSAKKFTYLNDAFVFIRCEISKSTELATRGLKKIDPNEIEILGTYKIVEN